MHGRNASGQPGLPRNGMTLSQVNTKVTPYALNLMMSTAEGQTTSQPVSHREFVNTQEAGLNRLRSLY